MIATAERSGRESVHANTDGVKNRAKIAVARNLRYGNSALDGGGGKPPITSRLLKARVIPDRAVMV